MINEYLTYQSVTSEIDHAFFGKQDKNSPCRLTYNYLISSKKAYYPLKIIARYHLFHLWDKGSYEQIDLSKFTKTNRRERIEDTRYALIAWLSVDLNNLINYFTEKQDELKNSNQSNSNSLLINVPNTIEKILLEIKRYQNQLPDLPLFNIEEKLKERYEHLFRHNHHHGMYVHHFLQLIDYSYKSTLIQEEKPQTSLLKILEAFYSWLKMIPDYLSPVMEFSDGKYAQGQFDYIHPTSIDIILSEAIHEGPLQNHLIRINQDNLIRLFERGQFNRLKGEPKNTPTLAKGRFMYLIFLIAYFKMVKQRLIQPPPLLIFPNEDITVWLGNQHIFENNLKSDEDPIKYFINLTKRDGDKVINLNLISKINLFTDKAHVKIDSILLECVELIPITQDKVENENQYKIQAYDLIIQDKIRLFEEQKTIIKQELLSRAKAIYSSK
jgi:hypothetical protein